MKFDVYFPFKNKSGVLCPGVKPNPMEFEDILKLIGSESITSTYQKIRSLEGKERAEAKKQLPAVCWTGRADGHRRADLMTPTQLVMIDIDHCKNAGVAWQTIREETDDDKVRSHFEFAHITPSGGLRLVMRARTDCQTLEENIVKYAEEYRLSRFGDVDTACKDFSRLSFCPQRTEVLFIGTSIAEPDGRAPLPELLRNEHRAKPSPGSLFSEEEQVGEFTDEEVTEFEGYEYRGTLVRTIVQKWVEVQGQPGKGEVHNYYNDMVKNFRNIVSNNKRALLYLLPRFGHSASECWSSIESICRVNTLSTLPRPFYFFLKDNGFYRTAYTQGSLAEYMLSDTPAEDAEDLPWFPPVFREFIKITPKDFRLSSVNAMLPILGTLTSYLQAKYYYDNRLHTTSFFSVIYAPPGTGKGFVERLTDVLFETLRVRDYIQQARENIYLDIINKKSQNEKSPDMPHTSLRIIPPKNSEAEFLQKQKDNGGYHMFTFAPEMDSWAKGVRAAGGNKDDMIRIAWDNGEYGQQFKSPNTFKGMVRLYWNVLITGTIQQLLSYFKNVENGLITRCSFTSIENQEFAPAPVWKELSKKDLEVVRKFMDRCDRNSYEEPCEIMPADVDCIDSKNFDNEVNWRFKFRERRTVNMEWLRPTIEDFLEVNLKRAALDLDKARDVFRRRAAVRGFRLGIICHALWERPRESDLRKCIPFIRWWMDEDLESTLKLWGARYNSATEDAPTLPQRSLFSTLSQAFTKNDVYAQCVRQGIKTPVRNIVHQWIKLGYVKRSGKNEYEKIEQKTK